MRADAALTKQTAQSTQPKNAVTQPQKTPARGGRANGAAAAAVEVFQPWTRRSYAILIGVDCVLMLLITVLQWAVAPSVSNGVAKEPVSIYLVAWPSQIGLIAWVAGSFFGAPIAQRISGESRRLRPVESMVVGLVVFFFATLGTLIVGTLVGLTSGTSSNQPGVASPCPTAGCSSARPSATASPAATPTPTPSSTGSASASPRAGSSATAVPANLKASDYAILGAADAASLVGTYFLYPPLYRRFRFRRPPPAPRGGGRTGGGKPS
ncbi:MAG: hypothetical protein JOZ46_09735 [Candidatus Dormibacteraeota bacterium]|nr:hypothetical protein [Candidatus Dormibacteraeota bacterium]MBV9526077.1 hypothetical protein [Candidatus Dormibacteraeota bacterium]